MPCEFTKKQRITIRVCDEWLQEAGLPPYRSAAPLTDAEILQLARAKLDNGLCFDRSVRITRSTDAEILAFAKALINPVPA